MNISVQRILFPTDFSEPAREAQQYAIAIAERWGAELHLLHVIDPIAAIPDTSSPYAAGREQQFQFDAGEKQLARELDSNWSKQNSSKLATVVGSIVEEILKYSTDNKIDLIVVGTHGRTGLTRMLIGSVAEKIVRLSKCPVLTVHPQAFKSAVDDKDA